MIQHIWIILALPLGAAVLTGLVGRRATRWAGILTSITTFFAFVLALKLIFIMVNQPRVHHLIVDWLHIPGYLELSLGVLVDPLSSVMVLLVTFVSLMVQIYSLGYMAEDPGRSRYFAFMSLFTFAMLGLVLAQNLVLVYMFWELVGLCSYLLIGFWYYRVEAANAAKKAFIMTRFGDLGFLIAILALAGMLGTLDIMEVGAAVAGHRLSSGWVTAVALLIFAGAMGKSAQFPFHTWLPDAMEGPTPVSALIHAATMVAAGIFLVARLFPIFSASEHALSVVATLGGVTAAFAATIACTQNDIKKILAYSTISQLGYMMMALGCGGYAAGIFHLSTHAIFKALLFLAAGSVIHALHQQDIWAMGGLFKTMKTTAVTMLTAALALAGLFPFAGFFSKDAILMAALHAERLDLVVLGLMTALLTSFYIFRLFFVVFGGKPAHDHPAQESPAVMILPMIVLALLAFGMGWLGTPLQKFLGFAWGAPKAPLEHSNRLIPLFAFLAAMLGCVWAYLVYLQKAVSANLLVRQFRVLYTLVNRKYYIDELYDLLIRRLVFAVAAGMAWFDRRVVDGAVNGVGWLCRRLGGALRLIQVGRVSAYVIAFVLGLVLAAVSVLTTHPAVWMGMK